MSYMSTFVHMKQQGFKRFMAFGLLLAYSLSLSVSIQNFIVDSVFGNDQHHAIATQVSDSKTPELSVFPDLDPLGSITSERVFNFQTENLKAHFQFLKHVETYIVTKDNQYLHNSKNIQPGLDTETRLYPFHTFS